MSTRRCPVRTASTLLIALVSAVDEVLQLSVERIYHHPLVPLHHPCAGHRMDTGYPRFHNVPEGDDMGCQAVMVEHLAERGLGRMVDGFGGVVSFPKSLAWRDSDVYVRMIFPRIVRHTVGIVAVGSRKYIDWIAVLYR